MFRYDLLKDPAYFRENRLDAHADLKTENPSFSLNGNWKFVCAMNETQVIPGFEKPETDCHDWQEIAVPAHIQLEGYGRPQYANIQYPWNAEEAIQPGEIPERFNPVACYVRYFYLPESMRGRQVHIRFDGVESCVALWLNGQYIGYSSDSFTPHEFDLTGALKDGENKLACRVYRYSAGSWTEDQDFLRFSGIYRDVTLLAVPETRLLDLQLQTVPPEKDADEESDKYWTLYIAARVSDPDAVLSFELRDGNEYLADIREFRNDSNVKEFGIPVEEPRLWSSEDPYLYDLQIKVRGKSGTEEVIHQKVGFRNVEIRDGIFRINGSRVVFKGVNRHDFCAETGRAVTVEKLRRDLILMKKNNINAIRTSHYPDSPALYDLCDELGLYVIAESNMESHGLWDAFNSGLTDRMFPGDYPDWQPLMEDRIRSACSRDRNHPCVVMWSCGNESLTGPVIAAMADLFRKLDPSRPVHYEGDCHAPEDRRIRDVTDVESTMYTPASEIRKYLKTHKEKPYILCEYVHAMGNSNGAMHKYTELAYEEPHYQGGFIWDFIDQSLVSEVREGKEILRYGGDWDDRPNDGIFCCDGIVFGDGKPTPKLQEIKYNYQNIVADVQPTKATVTNRSMFTDTSAYLCTAVLERDGEKLASAPLEISLRPGESGIYALPFPEQTVPGVYAVTLSFRLREDTPWAVMGYEVAFAQGTWKVEAPETRAEAHQPLRVVESLWNIGVHGENFHVIFSRGEGLVSYRFGDEEYLKRTPALSFWRAPVDNDNGNKMPQRYAQWKLASLYASSSLTEETRKWNRASEPVRLPDGSVAWTLRYDLATNPAAVCDVTWTVAPDGTVETKLRYDPVKGLTEPPEFGMLLSLKPELNRVRYLGRGPEENYSDRHQGARLGKFDFRVDENLTSYARPQECGNRTGVHWAEVTDYRGRGLRFECGGGEFSALPWTPHEVENAAHAEELPPVYRTVIRVRSMQMGVGGDDSWGARTHPEFLLDASETLEYRFSFKGITRNC